MPTVPDLPVKTDSPQHFITQEELVYLHNMERVAKYFLDREPIPSNELPK